MGILWLHLLTGDTKLAAIGKATKQALKDRGMDAEARELLGDCFSHDVEDRPKDAGELLARLPVSWPAPTGPTC